MTLTQETRPPLARSEERVVELLAKRFIARTDVKAVQQPDGSYRPDHTAWSRQDIRDHLSGERTYGHYLLNRENRCKLVAFDIDLTKRSQWDDGSEFDPRAIWSLGKSPARDLLQRQLRALGEGLAYRMHRMLKVDVALAYSGSKGLHVYGFTGDISADAAREAALTVLDCGFFVGSESNWRHLFAYPHMTIEIFPKQEAIRGEDGLGNLMRLPLGVHQKTSKSGAFLKLSAPHPAFSPDDPEKALEYGSIR